MKVAFFLSIIILLNPFLSIHNIPSNQKKYMREWWDIDAFFNDGKNYSVTSSFEYEKETPAANLFFTIFDHDENKFYDLGAYNESIDKLVINGNKISLENCWIKIGYPFYEAYFERKNVTLYIKLQALSPLQKIVGDVAKNIPFGFGYYNYTFTSKCVVSGWIEINGIKKNFTGIGYYEHVYGNWSYNKPLKFFSKDSIKDYFSLYKWWRKGMKIDFKNITIWSNNPFGYDWTWGFFKNGYTIFFGNIPFWIKNIPFGIIYIYNGKNYMEYKVTKYEYLNGEYLNGSFFPRKFKVYAIGNGSLVLTFQMTLHPHIYEDKLHSKFWKNLILYECPGKIYGWVNTSGNNIKLDGKGEIEIERQNSIFDYYAMEMAFKYPYPLGIEFYFLSYLLKISILMQLYLIPFSFNFSFSHIGK